MPRMRLKIMLPSYRDRVAAGMREADTKGWWHEGNQDGQAYLSAGMTQRFGVLRAFPALILLMSNMHSSCKREVLLCCYGYSLPKEVEATVAVKPNRTAGDCVVQLSILTGLR